jgi:hypothetical protein
MVSVDIVDSKAQYVSAMSFHFHSIFGFSSLPVVRPHCNKPVSIRKIRTGVDRVA